MFLAVSSDGLNYREANFGRPIVTPPSWGDGQVLMRDPSITFHGGVFHMVWTSNWTGDVFGYAHSTDLKNWSTPRQIRPFPAGADVQNTWAPEIDYDPARDDFFIVFSHRSNAGGATFLPYVVRTSDFETFTDAEVYFDPGYEVIDPDQVYDDRGTPDTSDDRWVMVYAGNTAIGLAFRDPMMQEPWDIREPVAGTDAIMRSHQAAEGPAIVMGEQAGEEGWFLYWDAFRNGVYCAGASPDLEQWTEMTDLLRAPVGYPRHGTQFIAPIGAVGVPMPGRAQPGTLYNGTFASETNGQPSNWDPIVWGGSAGFTYEPTGGMNGGACVRIDSDGGDLAWSTYASVDPDTEYRLTGWIKTEGLQRGSGLGAQINIHQLSGAITQSLSGDNDWTRVEMTFRTGARQEEIRINCLLGGWGQSAGTAWFDDLHLERACIADVDGSGGIDVDDVLTFLRAFSGG